MRFQGGIEVPFDQHLAFFQAIIRRLAPHRVRVAFWWLEGCVPTWSFPMKVIGSESPFLGSQSILGGVGRLVRITPQNVEAFLRLITPNVLGALIHMEVESRGQVQFAAYDFFTHEFFSTDIDTSFLDACVAEGLITEYSFY